MRISQQFLQNRMEYAYLFFGKRDKFLFSGGFLQNPSFQIPISRA